jgi:hypothetical protein
MQLIRKCIAISNSTALVEPLIKEFSLNTSSFENANYVAMSSIGNSSNNRKALIFCGLLALQFGLQPLLASRFTAPAISRSSVVVATEFTKIIIATVYLMFEPAAVWEKTISNWSLLDSLKIAALPATLYAIQNLMVQYGYQLLDSMTFNLLNQTKVLIIVC